MTRTLRLSTVVALTLLISMLLPWSPEIHAAARSTPVVSIGSKTFPESHILAEITALLLESHGFEVQRRLGLGGTLIAFEALQNGAIDLYPEYTGTLTRAVLRQPDMKQSQLPAALSERGLSLQVFMGFSNSYAIAVPSRVAEVRNISAIGDLASHPDLKLGFSLEFLNRGDGWPALQQYYHLPQRPSGIEHALAYTALDNGSLDGTDVYTTDGKLEAYDLRLLLDDRNFFPAYDAVLLSRQDLPAKVAAVLALLANKIDEPTMRSLNRRLAGGREDARSVAAAFLRDIGLANPEASTGSTSSERILGYTAVHLKLTLIALLLACAVAIPAALALSRYTAVARGLLYVAGLIQTIPALALLALLIPILGLGQVPAIVALFLYSLLPIIRNTLTGIFNVDPLLKDVATGMGLTHTQQLLKVELPLAAPTILAGVKTAAIISVGTATLAAFVGAGGLGEPIITGLTLNDHRRILEGAIPAALLAIAAELLFELIERTTIPAHLRV